jgi:hypothetical protein
MRSNIPNANVSGGLLAILATAAVLLPSACKRTDGDAIGTATASGCLETNPRPEKSAACQACLRQNWNGSPVNEGCCGVDDPVGLQLCETVSACIRVSGCNLAGDTTTCYCGTHQATCDQVGQANGPCVAQITAAAGRQIVTKTTDKPSPAQIMERYGDTKYAQGRAANIAAIAGAYCAADCGIGK